jgi:CRISPR-associated protein Cmr4
MNTQPYFLLAESDLHPGTGKVEGKAIDNPIQRETTSRFPKIEGSGLRGALKANLRSKNKDAGSIEAMFGKDPDTDQDQTKGLLKLQKSKIMLMPVYSPNQAITLYLTCPFVLTGFARDMANMGHKATFENVPLAIIDEECYADTAVLSNNYAYAAQYALGNIENAEKPITINGVLFRKALSESLYPVSVENDTFKDLRTFTEQRIVLVSDLFFSHCVQYKTTVHIGNHIDPKTGVVKQGALYSVEYLPQGSVLYTFATADIPLRDQEIKMFKDSGILETLTTYLDSTNHLFSLGGKSSVGKGLVKMEKVSLIPKPTAA